MAYLNRSADRRADVRSVLPTARSVIVTATIYNTAVPYSIEEAGPDRAHIARYAWGDDYHDVIGARLDALLAWMREQTDEPFDARPYVDTGPVQERVYARHAGVGWIGKNTCVINPQVGSWIFLLRSSAVCRSKWTSRRSINAASARSASKRARPTRSKRPACSIPRAAFRI